MSIPNANRHPVAYLYLILSFELNWTADKLLSKSDRFSTQRTELEGDRTGSWNWSSWRIMPRVIHLLSICRLYSDVGDSRVERKWNGMHVADLSLVSDEWRRAVLETSTSKLRPCQVGIVPPYL